MKPTGLPRRVPFQADGVLDAAPGAVLSRHGVLEGLERLARFIHLRVGGDRRFDLLFVPEQRFEAVAEEFLLRPAGHPAIRIIHRLEDADEVDLEIAVFQPVDQLAGTSAPPLPTALRQPPGSERTTTRIRRPASCVGDDRRRRLDLEFVPVPMEGGDGLRERTCRGSHQKVAQRAIVTFPVPLGDEVLRVAAERLLRSPSEQTLGVGTPRGDDEFFVLFDQSLGHTYACFSKYRHGPQHPESTLQNGGNCGEIPSA